MKLDVSYINELKKEIEELDIQLQTKRGLLREEIEAVNNYCWQIKRIEVFECNECGKEISYNEYWDNNGTCEECGGY